MTAKRRTASPMFQTPLTKAEEFKIYNPKKYMKAKPLPGKLICCSFCGQPDGTLMKYQDDPAKYKHEGCSPGIMQRIANRIRGRHDAA